MSVKKASYRLRVLQSNDPIPVTTIIFNDEPLPVNSDGSAQTVIVDNDVVETAVITPHVTA
jgi:hypothetical protein